MKMSLRLTLAVSFALLFVWLLFNQCDKSYGYGIVNNSGTSSEDSLNIAIPCLDSLGRPTACDSFYVLVFKSGTNAVVFRDSGTTAMAGLDTVMIMGRTFYYYHNAVANIDGGGAVGEYAIKIVSLTAVADLPTEINKEFQIVNSELSPALKKVEDIRGYLIGDDSTKIIYMATWGNGGNDGLSPFTPVCSLRTALQKCTGAKSYVIHIDVGTYSAQACTVLTDYVEIGGAGWNKSIIRGCNSSTTPIIYVGNASTSVKGFTIKNVHLLGYSDAQRNPGIRYENAENYSVEYCKFEYLNVALYGSGVYTSNSRSVIRSNIFRDVGNDGIAMHASNSLIDNNVIDSVYSASSDAIITGTNVNGVVIIRNYVHARVGDGIHLYTGSSGLLADNYVVANDPTLCYHDVSTKNKHVGNHITSPDSSGRAIEGDIASRLATSDFVVVTGNVVDDASNSASEFKSDLTNAVNDHYNEQLIIFTSGTNAGQVRIIIDYVGSSKYIKVSPAFEVEPTAGDDFKILYLLGSGKGIIKILE